MYLKSIEIQGFKSFANKILFDFHNGITGIVGPNGSGKSNVADAVRWVLGEQSAKQLRGSKMEDVIFAGTENRKPVGFAYVAITLDNSDHALPVEYDEVTVARRVYRSGESEYLINGNACRLKDVTEMFYDTGIGKEGYSIISQGQIDKILSGKPEERRELFDEAAGIVKFKRRKAAALKKLENERNNLVRVNDILAELEKQVGPLKHQSEKAKEYLNYKADLKKYDVNAFLLETDRIRGELKILDEKIDIADSQLSESTQLYESTKQEYEETEKLLNQINIEIENATSLLSNTELEKQRLTGQVSVILEQIKTFEANNEIHNGRIQAIDIDISKKKDSLENLRSEYETLNASLSSFEDKLKETEYKHSVLMEEIEGISNQIESRQNKMFDILNEKSSIKAENQKYLTMLEQLSIKKAELSSRIIKDKSDEASQNDIINGLKKDLYKVDDKVNETNNRISANNDAVLSIKSRIADLNNEADKLTQNYHREKSRLESLINITERYDGYGNSIRKIMELKDSNPGILGVIADIIKVERKYEVAIETALGGTIQNIVTDKENTAKELIAYLKDNKLGRATFLPLNAIQGKNTLDNDPCLKEEGVVGVASNLVKVSFEYNNLAKYLLGRILVVDNIDHALAIAKKYKYSLRIVTIEGEQLNPGGSMTGGAFKNSSNLLGRRREIEELKKNVSELSKSITQIKSTVSDKRAEMAGIRENIDADNKLLREAMLERNTVQVNLNQANQKLKELQEVFLQDKKELELVDAQTEQINNDKQHVAGSLLALDDENEASRLEIENLSKRLEEKKTEEATFALHMENDKLAFNTANQKVVFVNENIARINSEIDNLTNEKNDISNRIDEILNEIALKKKETEEVNKGIDLAEAQVVDCNNRIGEFKNRKDEINKSYKDFFDKREKINNDILSLEKESMRLHNQHDKLDESNDALVDYMWNEYELTYSYALELKNDELTDLSQIRKQINVLKSNIKKLGDVNVNAIEEYKEVSERYTFLKGQHDDMIEAEQTLIQVIDELDKGMRTQFIEKFEQIKVEFDKVFKELFGGGKGEIELVEDEDILEAGITIISQPPGKKLQNMMQLSGGEKALTAIALLFAIQNLKPSPFCLLDEIEAALDDSNVGRYANYLHKLTKHTQFIVITHRRGTMAAADRLYGITMQEKGVSALVSVDLIEKDLDKKKDTV
ncbi:MAG: chromosome segregation protein SMC [Lachnospira sp.]